MKKYILLLCFLFVSPLLAQAQESGIVINPRIIDEQVNAGDLLKYNVKIKNNSERKMDIYAMVNDISKTDGEIKFLDPSDLDRETSIARWIKFKRGVIELMPGDEISVPLEINVSGSALPGKRFARIAFPFGSNRALAGASMSSKSYAQLLINILVEENIIEKAQVKKFLSLKNVYLSPPSSFVLNLNNFGNQAIVPVGNIYIFNRRGEEIDKLNVNIEAESIAPGEVWNKTINWDNISGFGKYKAKLELSYGKKDKRDLQDTVFFWFFPWKWLLVFFLGTFIFLVVMISWIFRKTFYHQHFHQGEIKQIQKEINSDGVLNLKK